MSTAASPTFTRNQASQLAARLAEPRRHLQIVTGARQVGKTTLVAQVLERLDCPTLFASADEPAPGDRAWLAAQWERARISAARDPAKGAVLALDEVQKVPNWSEAIKRLWDEDSRRGTPLKVVVLGSAPLLVQRGLSESLAGRFEVLHLPHWSYPEMRTAFGFSLDEFLYFGGYPGAAPLASDPVRWRRYVLDSLVEPTIARDVLMMTRVDKPVLLRRLFELGCRYSGQVLSYTKMVGQLQDAGNTTTLAHYLDLLAAAGMLTGMTKFAGDVARRRSSSPKLQVLDTGLMSTRSGLSPDEARNDREFWGRLVESAIGAHLLKAALTGEIETFYWRERNREVDFVMQRGRRILAIEVKSGRAPDALPGLTAFTQSFPVARALLVGGSGIPVGEFLESPAESWFGQA